MGWMLCRVAFCTDIRQMYRHIKVDQRDANLQRIVWRGANDDHVKHYELMTVTYGLSCAPYLALRTLEQLDNDKGPNHPLAAPYVRTRTWMTSSPELRIFPLRKSSKES